MRIVKPKLVATVDQEVRGADDRCQHCDGFLHRAFGGAKNAFCIDDICADDPEAKRFAGTARYTINFDHPTGEADDWVLDLGRVCEAAHVKINGRDAGAAWCAPWLVNVGKFLQPGRNTLEVEVTNLAINRVRDLDIRQVIESPYFFA